MDQEDNMSSLEKPKFETTNEAAFKTPVLGSPEVIGTGEVANSTEMKAGSNELVFIEIKNDGRAIFKPADGEIKNLRKFAEAGTYYKRERAAYLISEFFGFGLVPATVIRREVEGRIGSAQQFIEDAKMLASEHELEEHDESNTEHPISNLELFDWLIWNSDRHLANLLLSQNRFHAVDNGLSFSADNIRTLNTVFDGQTRKIKGKDVKFDKIKLNGRISEVIFKNFANFSKSQELQDSLLQLLREEKLLTDFEIEALINRALHLGRLLEADSGNLDFDNLPIKFNEN